MQRAMGLGLPSRRHDAAQWSHATAQALQASMQAAKGLDAIVILRVQRETDRAGHPCVPAHREVRASIPPAPVTGVLRQSHPGPRAMMGA